MSAGALLDGPAPRRRAALPRLGAAAAWRRVRPALLVALPLVLAAAALWFAVSGWRAARDDDRIAALEAGRDRPVEPDARPALLAARIGFLAARDRLGETEPLLDALDRAGAVREAARARYVIGNARMRQAFALIGRGDLDKAAPQVTLARQDYRRALQARPEFWDAKYNLDVASRLVRDYPEFDRKTGDELRAEPKKIWTDIPGQPRGGP
ncbi:mxaK protein [Methylobacterium sp. 275MFSha3.1]|uniref:MxaK protein n=1 Tax=Methylobacterium sp. 275MFSha3.1 TaxID=1502746 RepID=UPI0008A7CE3B|nr:MxaK protein [Methylobacterium sp. 275MFSha3.1]SEI10774.1 mxaK protein [Methylobacterium sp. 275MFSha3.1]